MSLPHTLHSAVRLTKPDSFNGAVRIRNMLRRMARRLMRGELATISKEAVLDQYKALSRHLPGRTEESHDKP
jgi:hypothetical protein